MARLLNLASLASHWVWIAFLTVIFTSVPLYAWYVAGFGVMISSASLLLVSVTMLVRANDLGWRPGLVWHIRRIGFAFTGFGPWGVIYMDISQGGSGLTVFEIVFRLGLALVFVTTPYLPPWWKWMLGVDGADQAEPHWSDDRRGMPKTPEKKS